MNRIKELRKKKGLTQAQFGALWNAPQNTVSNWENGNREISNELLIAFSEYFGVSVDYLLGRDEQTNTKEKPIDPHTYYAYKFGAETQEIVDQFLAMVASIPDQKKQLETAEGAKTFAQGMLAKYEQEGKA